MNVRGQVSYLVKKHGTRNPFHLANKLHITVIFEDLGTVNGYYNKQLRMRQIHINQNLPDHLKEFTCAHELGHALLHPDSNVSFLQGFTNLSVDKMEAEANKFGVELLITDDLLNDYHYLTVGQLAKLLGYSEELIKLRLN